MPSYQITITSIHGRELKLYTDDAAQAVGLAGNLIAVIQVKNVLISANDGGAFKPLLNMERY